jgi:4-hydroxy-4-methyl-2-oxoglutarate aldolase
MTMDAVLTPEELVSLCHLDTCQVADAIETFDVRLRNEGFMDSSVRCMIPNLPSMVGYAVTAQFRTSEPPMSGKSYPDRTDWWNYLLTIPAPRVVVLEDLDRRPGLGSCAGEVHAHIFKALGSLAWSLMVRYATWPRRSRWDSAFSRETSRFPTLISTCSSSECPWKSAA